MERLFGGHSEGAFLRSVLEAAPDFILVVSRAHEILWVNRLYPGLEHSQVIGSSIYNFVEPGFADTVRAVLERIAATGRPGSWETEGIGPHGTMHYYLCRAAPIRSDRELVGFTIIATDVTDRKLAELAVRESESIQRMVLEASEMGVWSWEIEPDVVHWDDRLYDLHGISRGRPITAADFFRAVHPDDRQKAQLLVEQALATGSYDDLRCRVVRPDGSVRWIHCQAVLRRDAEGRPVRLVGGATDITAQVRLGQQLDEARRLEAIGRLAGGVAHDFNNLLTVVIGGIELARGGPQAPLPQAPALDDALDAAKRAASLTRQLLAFARRQPISPRDTDLNRTIREFEPLVRRLLGEGVELELELSPELWPVRIDPAGLEQVLLNLVMNGRDAMPLGGRLRIGTRNVPSTADGAAGAAEVPPVAPDVPHVRLTVSDSGEGMTDEVRARIFEPFFTTKPVGAGTGLGLATVYGIVTQHGGTISATSTPGGGTTFHACLPRAERAPELRDDAPAPPQPSARGDETVLVVEDDPVVRSVATRTLVRLGYQVLQAGSGAEALVVAANHPGHIHLLLTDVVMPGLGGRELASQLSVRCPELRVLFASGYPDAILTHHGVLAEGVDLLPKPFGPAELASAVRGALDR
ncbi:MAG: PAS domain S-box protein [Deltaproteobacteria bacterium]|nr:PAS domain S-box protein [Deltaproteobacteria bacterium]